MKIIIEVDGDISDSGAYLKALNIEPSLIHSIKFENNSDNLDKEGKK